MWIAVEDDMPDNNLEVLATDGEFRGTASVLGDQWLWSTHGLPEPPEGPAITHWQHLPDLPPKKESP